MKKLFIYLNLLLIVCSASAQWFPQNPGTMNTLQSVFFADSINGFTVGSSGTIIKTSDGGMNWTIQNSTTVEDLYFVCFAGPDI